MFQTTILALVQSVAEFLPISSSAHLILVPYFFNWKDQGLIMDIALHVGTLFSVLIYFRKDVAEMIKGAFDCFKRQFKTPQSQLVLKLFIACLPVFIIGFLFHNMIEDFFRNPHSIAFVSILFGILLYVADKKSTDVVEIKTLSFRQAFLIGLAQVLALIPGVSRSGVTMTMARALGVNRQESARFSMLLSIPTISAASGLIFLKIFSANQAEVLPSSFILSGMLISFIIGFFVIGFLMRWLKRSSFAIFAFYRVLLGLYLFYFF